MAKMDTISIPIVVIVNRNTASAAEIVSGALQDHDRALIVGETTFGKGLVQTVFQISENTGLALTTYHYYTPSGRLIQRSYDGVSLYDYYYVRDDAKKADKSNLEVKLTDSGRTVYGGGGITPDEKIRCSGPEPLPGQLLAALRVLRDFASTTWRRTRSPRTLWWTMRCMQQFKDFLKANQIEFTDADIAGHAGLGEVEYQGGAVYLAVWPARGLKVRAQTDPEIIKAATFMPEAMALEDRDKSQQKTASLVH